MKAPYKPISEEDFKLTPEEMKILVETSQQLLRPDDKPVDRTPDKLDNEGETSTS